MTEQNQNTDKPEAKKTAAVKTPETPETATVPALDAPEATPAAGTETKWVDPEPKEVTLQLGDGPKVQVTKPSGEYTQLVNGYGYEEV